MIEKLLEGAVEFRRKDYEDHKDLFISMGRSQNPHTLFIGCADSRVVPNMITSTLPGELFVVRNIANIVPPYRDTEEFVATTSAIEYAVLMLNVKNIIVCGHSNCGGCNALYLPEERLDEIPHVKKWLDLARKVKPRVEKAIPEDNPGAREWLTEQMNIVQQMRHLLTYPFIKERYRNKELFVFGWYYIIETGEVFHYNEDQGFFEPINSTKL